MARLLLRDLTPATRYKVQIRAVEGDSVSEWSRLFDLETIVDTVSPDVPLWDGVGWVSSGDTFVATWLPIDPAEEQNLDLAYYEIELSDGFTTHIVNTQNTTYTLTFSDNRTIFGTPKATVLARVRAVDAFANRSAWGEQKSASNPRPAAPASITPTAVADGIGLKWDASPDNDVVAYQVHTGSTSDFTPSSGNRIFLGNALEFNYATLTYGTDHWFKVYAVDVFGQTSLVPTATTQAVRPTSPFVIDTVAPSVPTDLAATITNNANGVGSRAAVSWTMASPPSDLSGFYVRYRKVGDTNWSTVSFQKEERAGTIELLSIYQNYEFQIKAVDSYANESAWSATVTATAPTNTAPGNVTGLTATPSRDAIAYKWNQVSDVDIKNYEVTFSTSSTFASGNITFLTGEAAFLNVGGLTPGTTYYARVRAVDTGGLASGSWSATNTTSTLAQLTPGDIGAPTSANTVKNFVTEYAVNSSESTAPTTGWSTTTPTRTPGQFIWYRVVITYGNDTTSTSNPALLTGNTGADGNDGAPGAPGRGISSTTVTYQKSTNGTTAPTGTWTSTIPTTSPGEYLWTRTVYNYTDSTSDTAYAVSAHGATGTAGKGISSTAVTYQVGTSGTTEPTGTWTTSIPATAPGQFLWTRTITTYTDSTTTTAYSVAAHGEAGSDGADGVGISTTTVTYQTHTSGTTAPTGTWSSAPTATTAGQFLWTRTVTTYTDNSTSTAYSVSAHGATGSAGRGVSSTAVTYQVGSSGTTAPTGTWTTTIPATTAGQFLWTRTVTTYTDNSTTTAYSVAAHGATGSAGKGISSTAVTYQTHTNGTTAPTGTWSSTPTATSPGQFLWTRTVLTYTDSTTSTAYAVSAHGSTGEAGKGVSSTAVTYQVGTSGTTEPTGAWSTSIPATAPGQFLWTRTITTYTDSSTTTAYSVAAHGTSGADGNDGADGVGISGTTVTYQKHTSGTTAPTGTWTTAIPSTVAGEFLWTRTVTTFTDTTSTTAYSVSAHGATGSAGRGISSTAVTYQASSSGTTTPTGTWSTTVPAVPAGQFLWTRTIVTYTDSSTSTSYSVAGFGTNGSNGTSVTGVKPWFARVNTGSTPTQPANGTVTPAAPWQDTEPAWVSGTELWRTEAISFSSGTSPIYTTQTKVATYGAITTAITSANGKNQVIFSTGDATGTADANGVAYTDGDIWYKRDANGVVIATWEFIVGTGWVSRTFGDATLASLNVGKLVSGDLSATTINLTASGVVKSTNYDTVAKTGWKLDASGLDIQSGSVRASALVGDTLGSSTGIINIAAGAAIVLNGGYLKSNTYTGTTYNAAATAGWFLNNDGLVIAQGAVKASTLTSGTMSAATIELSGASGIIQTAGYNGTSGFKLSGSGLEVKTGAIEAAALRITAGNNLVNAQYASFEGRNLPTAVNAATLAFDTANFYDGSQALRVSYNGTAGTARGFTFGQQNPKIRVEAGKSYFISAWARNNTATAQTVAFGYINNSNAYTSTGITNNVVSVPANTSGWARVYATLVVPAGVTEIMPYITNTAASFDINFDSIQVEEKLGATTPGPWISPGLTSIDGSIIKTGSIQSQTNVTVNGASVPAWSINTNGFASFAGAQILGNTVLGNAGSDTNSVIQSFNYVAGSTGWMIRADGTAEFSTASLRGSLSIGQVTNLQSSLDAKASTTYVDTTAQTKANEAEIGALEALATNTNSSFGNWTSSFPTGYSSWAGTLVKETALAKTINAVRFNVALNADAGLNAATSFGAATHAEYVAVEMDVMLVDNSSTASFNGAGIILDWNTSTYRTLVSLGSIIPAPVFGKWYKVVQVIRKPQNSLNSFTGYIMANWSGFGVARDAKNIIFDRVALRPASDVEINAVTAVSQVQDLWGSQQDRTLIDGGNIYTDTITLDKLRGGSLTKVINLDTGSSLLSTGVMGEQVAMGDFGFYVKGPQENTVTNKASSGTTRTLTTAVAHKFEVGQKIVVKIGDTSYDNNETNKFWNVASVPSATTFTYTGTTSLTQSTTAVATGIVQGANPDLPAGQDYIVFPTDGTQPNIISGQLTASNVVVTEGMSIRKTSSVEQSAQLILNAVVEAPKIAPALSQNYSEIQITGYSGTLIDIARGHNGNYFVLAGTTNNYRISEHNAGGSFIANRVNYNVSSTAYQTPRGLTYSSIAGGRYYLHIETSNRTLMSERVDVFNTSWVEQNTFLIGSRTDSTKPFNHSRIGWDYTNNRMMFIYRTTTQTASPWVRFFTMDANGIPTAATGTDFQTSVATNNVQIGFVARGDFDFGAGTDRIVIKDGPFGYNGTSQLQYVVATNTGASDSTRNWPVANDNSIAGAFWDTTRSKFEDMNTSGIKRIYEGGDSFWLSTTMTDVRWVRYAWYNDTNDAESNLSAAASISLSKRARLTATISPVPYTGGSTPNKARVYVLDNPTDTFPTVTNYRLRVTVPYTSQTATIDPYNLGTVGTAQPTVNDFALYGNNPGQIVSSTGKSYWKGDDTAQFYQLVLTSDVEASPAAGNKPALRIGDINGQHLRIDSNEIIAMESDSTRVGGELELSADNVRFNLTDGALMIVGSSNFRAKVRTQNDAGTAFVFNDNRIIAGLATWNTSGPTATNTVTFHASDIHSWTGGIFMEDLAGGGTTGATINNNGRIIRSSTIKMKENVKPMTMEEAKTVLGLESYTFEFKQTDDGPKDPRRYPGFIAEQAAEAGAELWVARQHNVARNPDGSIKSIRRNRKGDPVAFRTPDITVAHNVLIKELYAKNEALEAENTELNGRLDSLEAMVRELAAKVN